VPYVSRVGTRKVKDYANDFAIYPFTISTLKKVSTPPAFSKGSSIFRVLAK
jgi:hypothetical protein